MIDSIFDVLSTCSVPLAGFHNGPGKLLLYNVISGNFVSNSVVMSDTSYFVVTC